jgi:predicted RNA-binding Zn-ribbon protein involved in translation (DUF1610 family)
MTDSDRSDTVTAREWFCPTCGDEIDAHEECESWPCAECGTEMEPLTRKSEYVPIGVLEDLIEESIEGDRLDGPVVMGDPPYWNGVHEFAYELQEVIDTYGDADE